jgi:hypothetical protein
MKMFAEGRTEIHKNFAQPSEPSSFELREVFVEIALQPQTPPERALILRLGIALSPHPHVKYAPGPTRITKKTTKAPKGKLTFMPHVKLNLFPREN